MTGWSSEDWPASSGSQLRAGGDDDVEGFLAWFCIGLALGREEPREMLPESSSLPDNVRERAESYGRHLLGLIASGSGRLAPEEQALLAKVLLPGKVSQRQANDAGAGLNQPARYGRVPESREQPFAGSKGLSATERAVAHLVAEGYSNKAIAATLFISRKTVEFHISNIYRRLGVASRVKLAQLVLVA